MGESSVVRRRRATCASETKLSILRHRPNQLIVSPLSAAVTLAVGLSTFVCAEKKTRATDRAAVASVWRSLPGVMVPCGCLCIVLSSYCQLFTRDSIPSGNENLASLARPYFPFLPSPFRSRMRVHGIRSGSRDYARSRNTVWFTRLPPPSSLQK